MERLSSGYKINRAGDNPAGIAISSKMRAQINALDQAESNASDGISVLNIADGALNEVSNMLQRMRELTVQAGNDTNSYNDRQSIQDEIDALVKEVDRISTDTEYNSKTLLDGSCNTRVYSKQVERLDVSENVLPDNYALTVNKAAEKATCEVKMPDGTVSGTIKINGVTMDYAEGTTSDDFFQQLRDTAEQAGCEVKINPVATGGNTYTITSKEFGSDEAISLEISKDLGEQMLDLTAGSGVKLAVDATSAYAKKPDTSGQAEVTFTVDPLATDGIITINGVELDMNTNTFYQDLQDVAQQAGCTVSDDGTGTYTLVSSKDISFEISGKVVTDQLVSITETDVNHVKYCIDITGTDTEINLDKGFSSTATYTADGTRIRITDVNGFSMDFRIKEAENKDNEKVDIEVTDIGAMTLQIGANQYQEMDVRIPEVSAKSLYLDTVDVTVSNGSDKALVTLDEAISKLGDVRSGIGAYSNRLEYATNSLSETQEDLTAAFSNLMDTDMAEEMTEYTQQNVLEQAAISVLAQANDLPQQVLSLLQ
jgi:flagellin